MSALQSTSVHNGSCSCGSVSFTVTGSPLRSAYCHCTLCQRLNACPFVHTIHFPASAFTWTHSTPHDTSVEVYDVPSRPWKKRARCRKCGGSVASYNSRRNVWSVWGAVLERDQDGKIKDWEFLKPTVHIFYGTRMLDITDELPKWEGYENESTRVDKPVEK